MMMLHLILASLVLSSEPPPKRLVVLDLSAPPELQSLAETLSQRVTDAYRESHSDMEFLGESEIKAMLSVEAQKQVLGCEDDTQCLAEIASALGAGRIVVGRLGSVGDTLQLSMRLIDSREAKVLRSVSEDLADQEQLLEAVRQCALYLLDPTLPLGRAVLRVDQRGRVKIDGREHGESPGNYPLAPGQHTVEVSSATGGTVERELNVRRFETVRFSSTEAVSGPKPWYKKWWVWGVGAAVVGGTAAAIVLSRDDGGDGGAPEDVTIRVNPADFQ